MYDADEDYASTYYGTGMGIALPAIGGAISAIGGIFGGDSKDPNRIATNTRAYNLAVSNPSAIFEDSGVTGLEFLRMHSQVAQGGSPGWATAAAANDAKAKYTKAQSVLAATGGTGTAYASPSASSVLGANAAGLSVPPLLLAGAAAIGIAMLMKSGRRR